METLTQRYKRLGTYRAVAASLNDVASPAMVRLVIKNHAWSPRIARELGIEKRRWQINITFRTEEELLAFREIVLNGQTPAEWARGQLNGRGKVIE